MILNVILIIIVMIIYILVLSAGCWTISTLTGAIARMFRKVMKRLDIFINR